MENVENKMSETFAEFGESPNQMEGEVIVTKITEIVTEVHHYDFKSLSLEEIANIQNIPIIPKEETFPNFNQVLVRNKYYKLYLAKTDKLSVCSLLILNDVSNNKNDFGKLLQKLAQLNDLTAKCVVKLRGIVILEPENQCYLLFEPLMSSYRKKLDEKIGIEANTKYAILFYLIELISQCHERDIGLMDIKPSTLLFNNFEEFKYLIPFCKLYNLKFKIS
jgi:hypothetical protein